MKNFPHQFNDLERLSNALRIAKKLIDSNTPLTDENFGEILTRERIYTYRDKSLSIDQFLEREKQKPRSNRGYLTVSRDTRRFLGLLGFIVVLDSNKNSQVTTLGKQLLLAKSYEQIRILWKNSLMQLGLEGKDGEISHPYRILLKIVNKFPGIETRKLMLALEAKNDTEEEFERISNLANINIEEIIQKTGTSQAMAANAVKILPGIAEQLNDIFRIQNRAYPVGQIIVTEDEISTIAEPYVPQRGRIFFREVTSDKIAKDPSIMLASNASIDLSDAIKTRQNRLVDHQEIVRLLAVLNEQYGFNLYEGRFDCLAIKNDKALLYEIKTILENVIDQEKQTIKGVGQLKFYKFSIENKLEINDPREILVFSMKPDAEILDFCNSENIFVIWRENKSFLFYNSQEERNENFDPDILIV